MNWFKRNKEDNRLKVAKSANLEIALAKEASQVATQQAIEDANQLKELLERNHFSVTLYISVGGENPVRRKKQ